jgi:hypothetical protein
VGPSEGADLALRPGYAPVMRELRARLERWMRDTDVVAVY